MLLDDILTMSDPATGLSVPFTADDIELTFSDPVGSDLDADSGTFAPGTVAADLTTTPPAGGYYVTVKIREPAATIEQGWSAADPDWWPMATEDYRAALEMFSQQMLVDDADPTTPEVKWVGTPGVVDYAIIPAPSPPPPSPSPAPAPPSPSLPPVPPSPFAPAAAGKIWVGTMTFQVSVTSRRRRLEVSGSQVETAVTKIFADDGLTLGQQVFSVVATDDGAGGSQQTFTITIVGPGPYLKRASELVSELDFSTKLGTEMGGATVDAPVNLQIVFSETPGPSPPSSPDQLVDPPLADSEGDDQTAEGGGEAVPGWAVFLIVLLILCCLWPFCCCCYARNKYGEGNVNLWFRYRMTHSNPTLPFLYMPREDRDRIRKQLYKEESEQLSSGADVKQEKV